MEKIEDLNKWRDMHYFLPFIRGFFFSIFASPPVLGNGGIRGKHQGHLAMPCFYFHQ